MRKLLVLIALGTITFAGCGGDDDAATGTASTSTTAGGDGEFSGEGSDDFCDLARDYAEKFDQAGETEATTPAEAEAELANDYDEFAKAIKDLVGEAPEEIEADVRVVSGAFDELNELLEKYDYDFEKIPQEEAASIDLDNAEVEAANNRIESYFEKVCGIDTDDDGDTDGDIGGTSAEEQAPDESVDDGTTADPATDE